MSLLAKREIMQKWLLCHLLFLWCLSCTAQAEIYPWFNHSPIVGEMTVLWNEFSTNLAEVAYQQDLSFPSIQSANPDLDPWWIQPNTMILVAKQHIIPGHLQKGIVINLAEKRLYFLDPDQHQVVFYPIGIGTEASSSPQGFSFISEKRFHPYWFPPISMIDEYLQHGQMLPLVEPSGLNNSLGFYALAMHWPGILIHGSPQRLGIGIRSSHGCFRMYPKDIKQLYQKSQIHTPVEVIDQPVKWLFEGELLWLEVNPAVAEDIFTLQQQKSQLIQVLQQHHYAMDLLLPAIEKIFTRQDGLLTAIRLTHPNRPPPFAVNLTSYQPILFAPHYMQVW